MKNKKYIIMLIIIILLIVIDQVAKLFVINNLSDNQVLIENVISIEKVENMGMAFGFNKENIQNIFLSLFVLLIMIRFIIKHDKQTNMLVIICLSMIIAGGISNLIDRVFRGAVFDFIKLGINFPVFNFADIFIFIGWIIYMIYLLIFAFKTV